MELNHLNLN